LESFDKAHSAVVEIGQIGREIVSTLALTSDKAAVLSDENVATTAKLANLLEKH
jgi:hypothetical protein